MRILYIGDVVGQPGRECVTKFLPRLRDEFSLDFVIANAENSAGGLGATPETLKELTGAGCDAFTMGNHTWRKKAIINALDSMPNIIRPANYPEENPGRGSALVDVPGGGTIGMTQVLGRVYMDPFDDPFEAALREAANLRDHTTIVLVDVHAEATSEKVAIGWYLDGRCSAVVGTHTHVQTADERVLPGGTAYITDVGMTGPMNGVIGTDRDRVIKRFVTGMPAQFTVAKGPAQLCGVVIDVDDDSGKARSITRVSRDGNSTPE